MEDSGEPFLMEAQDAATDLRQPPYFEEEVEEMALEPRVSVSREGPLEIFDARVVRLDGPKATLEFEVPRDGFTPPVDQTRVRVVFLDGNECEAVVAGDESSPPGPHEAGLTVRLVLVIVGGEDWGSGEVQIHWSTQQGDPVTLYLAPIE
jgi:hypothetical protein